MVWVCRNVNFWDGYSINVTSYQLLDLRWNILKKIIILKENYKWVFKMSMINILVACWSVKITCEVS